MKVGEIVERDGSKYLVTKVYTLCGCTAYDSVPALDTSDSAPAEKKAKGAAKKTADTSDSAPAVDPGTDETPEE
jgi:hypothetical protein